MSGAASRRNSLGQYFRAYYERNKDKIAAGKRKELSEKTIQAAKVRAATNPIDKFFSSRVNHA